MSATGLRAEPRPSRLGEARRAPRAARPGLRVLDKQAAVRRARRRQARVTFALAACVVAGALLVVAGANSMVVAQQVRLDSLRTQVAAALAQDQDLQVQRAVLESPTRILSIAEHQLGMVTPSEVRYLSPVAVGALPTPAPGKPSTRRTSRRR